MQDLFEVAEALSWRSVLYCRQMFYLNSVMYILYFSIAYLQNRDIKHTIGIALHPQIHLEIDLVWTRTIIIFRGRRVLWSAWWRLLVWCKDCLTKWNKKGVHVVLYLCILQTLLYLWVVVKKRTKYLITCILVEQSKQASVLLYISVAEMGEIT